MDFFRQRKRKTRVNRGDNVGLLLSSNYTRNVAVSLVLSHQAE